MEGVKIYGLCLERLRHQINNAMKRFRNEGTEYSGRVLLESYNTGEPEEIIDILELYGVKERTPEELREKLDDLAYTVSELVREKVIFDYTDEGYIGLYLEMREGTVLPLRQTVAVA